MAQNPTQLNHPIDEKYKLLLNKSIDDLLQPQTTDTSSSLSTLYKLIESKANPPLESIWVCLSVHLSDKKSPKGKFLDRVSSLNELFQLMKMCSASSTHSECILLLAPFIYEVYKLIVDMMSKIEGSVKYLGDSKKEKKLMKKIESLVYSFLEFISVSCSGIGNEPGLSLGSDELFRPLEDLIGVWIGNRSEEDVEEKEKIKLFFPVLGVELQGSSVSELAGAVIAEGFLLRFCLDLHSGVSEQDLKVWAIGSITQFRNLYFFETLVRMLLEQSLPVTSLLSSENEATLRKVLFDAVILPEYSFLDPDTMVYVSAKRILSLSILRVLVTHAATESYRKNGDHTKALSYINAFSSSKLPSQLVNVISNNIILEEADQPKGKSPKAILTWLRNLEDQGMKILDDSISKFSSRLAFDSSEDENKIPKFNSDPDLVFYIDNKGEAEDEDDERVDDSMTAAFVAAASTMNADENRRDRKRKNGKSAKRCTKFRKHEVYSEVSGACEVENPLADDVDSEDEK